jgi:hypothetical protein
VGGDPSKLLGSLQADGKFFLINPKGLVIGRDAVIDTAAFAASTLDVSDADFLRGNALTFKGDSDAGIVNLGRITAREGNVMLFAHTVENAGTISASKGKAALGAGTEVFVASPDGGMFEIKLNLPKASAATGVENSGVIDAAQAELKAAGGSIYELAINQSGVIHATGVVNKNGRVLLTGDGGTVGVSGEVSARNADGSGGEILVGGDYRGGQSGAGGPPASGAGGMPAPPNAARTVVTASAKLDASAAKTGMRGGRVIVWADEATRFLGRIDAHGGGGGFAEVSGRHFLDFRPAGAIELGRGGTLLLDPDALVVSSSADNGTSTSAGDPFTFGASTEPATLNVTTLETQLANSDVILDTSNSAGAITFDGAVTWASDHSLTAKAGGAININASLTGGAASSIVLRPGKAAMPDTQGPPPIFARATLDAAAVITTGTLVYGSNPDAAPAGYHVTGGTASADFEGNLNVGELQVDLAAGPTGVGVFGADNTIGAFRTTGGGDLTFAWVANQHGDLAVKLATTASSASQITISTPGRLTLESGSDVSFASPGTVVLASTGGGFVNEAGGSVFGANTNYLVYASSTAATTKDGLTGGDVFGTSFDANDPIGGFAGLDRFIFSAASASPILTYTADDTSRVYGSDNPSFGFSVSGYVEGVTNDVTGAPALSTTATRSSGVNAYTISISQGSLVSTGDNYAFAFVPGTLTITAAPLKITANDASRTPFGADPVFGVTYSGFVLGQDASVVSGLTVTTTATGSSPVGTYPITPANATAPNYAITFVPGTLTIADVSPLLIKANDASRLYGAADPVFTATYTGLLGSDTPSVVTGLQFATTAGQASGVGTYTITPFGASAPGYDISYDSGTLTIERAPLVITPLNASRFYGDPNVFTASYSGLVLSDTAAVVSGLRFDTTATQASDVGTYTVTASGASAANYAISYGGSAQLTINRAPITVRFDDKTRLYGDPNPELTYSISGLKNGDSAEASVSVSGVFTTAAATDGIGDYGINGTVLALSSNYDAQGVPGTLEITPRPLTITAPSFTREYYDLDPISSPDLVDDATKADPRYAPVFTGLASFDTPAAIPDVKLTTEANLFSGVSTFGILVSSGLNRNYAITYRFGSLTITPRPIYFTVDDFTKSYGRANPDLLPTYNHGLAPADTLSGLGLQVDPAILAARNVGSYDIHYTLTNPNYELFDADLSTPFYHAPLAGKLTITPAPLTVTVAGAGRLYGDTNPAPEVQVLGLAFGDKADDVLAVSNPTNATTPVGRYDYGLTLKGATPNYTIADNRSGMFQINPRLITLSVDMAARYYGDPNPAFGGTFGGDGLAAVDSMDAVLSGFKTAQATDAMTDIGLYRIDPVFKSNPNYVVSWTPGYMAILPRPIEITVNNGIVFGNNNIPDGFSVGDTGIDLVRYTDHGTVGHTVIATNLPAGVTFTDIAPHLYFEPSDTNDPSPVVSSPTTPEEFLAQFKPPATTPADLPADTAVFPPGSLPSEAVPASAPAVVIATITVVDGLPVLDATPEEKKRERFADSTVFMLPRGYGNPNYAITKITNGVLTMKADPVVVNATLTAEEAKRKHDAAAAAFNEGRNAAGAIVPGAFGFSQDMYILIFQALGIAIDQDFKNGNTGADSIVQIINGGEAKSLSDVTGDDMLMWLSDIHTNPAKQALMMPIMINYAMTIAYQDPKTWTAPQAKLMEQMKSFIADGRQQFIDSAKQAQADWTTANADVSAGGMAGGIAGLYGLEVTPYEKFIGAAVEDSVAKAVSGLDEKFKAKTSGMTQQDLAGYIGVAAGGVSGATIGTVVGTITATNLMKILPNTAKDIERAAQVVGKVVKAGTKAATEATEAAARGARAVATVETLSNTIAGPAEIISFAIEAAITQGMRAGEEDEQRISFNKLLSSGSDPIDPHAMMQNDIGRAEMMLGLMAMFGGG